MELTYKFEKSNHPRMFPILSSKQFPIITEANFSQPIDAQAVRLLVPTFILLNELHFNPRCTAKLS